MPAWRWPIAAALLAACGAEPAPPQAFAPVKFETMAVVVENDDVEAEQVVLRFTDVEQTFAHLTGAAPEPADE